MDLDEIVNITNQVDGWLTDNEGRLLYNLASSCTGRGVIVEIGSWKGKSTIWLANGSKKGSNIKVFAIDPHEGIVTEEKVFSSSYEDFRNFISIAKVDDIVNPIVKTSEDAVKTFTEQVELIFIDGLHEYDYVKLDFELWFPKLLEGGIMAFHDAFSPGVNKVIKEKVFKSSSFIEIKFVDSILYARKVGKIYIKDRISNWFVYYVKLDFVPRYSKYVPKAIKNVLKFFIYNI